MMNPARLSREAPRVKLLSYFENPYDLSIAAARTCYMPRVVEASEITERQRDSIGRATYDGGHHTVYQHAHFVFGLENISRQFVWSFLHSHPFYNSEQSSQRFVRLDSEVRVFIPPIEGKALEIYGASVRKAWSTYKRLTEVLRKDTWHILADLRHYRDGNDKRKKKIEREAEKKAFEIARYVIPVSAFTSMVHTVSGITLHRLQRMIQAGDAPHEASLVVAAMVELVREVDPLFFDKIGESPLAKEELPEFSFPQIRGRSEKHIEEFDRELQGGSSKLIDFSENGENVIAQAARAVLGLPQHELTTTDALARLLDPRRNPLRTDTLNVGAHSPLMRALNHVVYTFMKNISHTADSQDQRHRMVPASRPLMSLTDTWEPDYRTPMLISQNREARSLFEEAMQTSWNAKNRLLDLGVPLEWAMYVLPNAKALRFIESGSLLYLMHKWTMRTCFNAQEEIYQASMEELSQIKAVHPYIASFMGPPCVIRNGIVSPRCTEGDRFCGVPVWRDFPDVKRPI